MSSLHALAWSETFFLRCAVLNSVHKLTHNNIMYKLYKVVNLVHCSMACFLVFRQFCMELNGLAVKLQASVSGSICFYKNSFRHLICSVVGETERVRQVARPADPIHLVPPFPPKHTVHTHTHTHTHMCMHAHTHLDTCMLVGTPPPPRHAHAHNTHVCTHIPRHTHMCMHAHTL